LAVQPFARIVNKCLRKELNERYRTANELLAELRSVRGVVTSGAYLVSPVTRELSERSVADISRNSPSDRNASGKATTHFLSRRYFWPVLFVTAVLLALTTAAFLYRRSATLTQSTFLKGPHASATTGKLYSQMSDAESHLLKNKSSGFRQ
jgi:hypothetical protein